MIVRWTSTSRACPYLRPTIDEPPVAGWVAAYCAPPLGRVRVPSREELVSVCTGDRHRDCAGYRRARLRGTTGTGLA